MAFSHQDATDSNDQQLVVLKGATDNTSIGNSGNKLLVDGSGVSQPVRPTRGTLTDRSGTIASALTSTQIVPSNSSRNYLFIQNVDVNVLWINFTSAATQAQPSISLSSGQSFVMENSFVSTEAVFAIAQTPNSVYTAKEG